MSCSACSSHVEKAVNKLENVEKASVNLLTETMDVTYDETKITSAEIIDAVVKAGYGASVMTEGSVAGAGGQSTSGNAGSTGKSTADGKQELQQKLDADARAMKWRLGISIGFLIPMEIPSRHFMALASASSFCCNSCLPSAADLPVLPAFPEVLRPPAPAALPSVITEAP